KPKPRVVMPPVPSSRAQTQVGAVTPEERRAGSRGSKTSPRHSGRRPSQISQLPESWSSDVPLVGAGDTGRRPVAVRPSIKITEVFERVRPVAARAPPPPPPPPAPTALER